MIVFDPGHGGHGPAGKSTASGHRGQGGSVEKDLALAICQAVAARNPRDVVLTRRDDRNISLGERIRVSREAQAKSFVSVHLGHGDRNDKGSVVWTHTRGGPRSDALARRVATALSAPGREARVERGELAVLDPEFHDQRTAAILVEVDNLANPGVEAWLQSPDGIDAVAETLAGSTKAPNAAARAATKNDETPSRPKLTEKQLKLYQSPFYYALESSNAIVSLRNQVLDQMLFLVNEAAQVPVATTSASVKARLGHYVLRTALVTATNLALTGAGSVINNFIDHIFDTHGPSNLNLYRQTLTIKQLPGQDVKVPLHVAGRSDGIKSVTLEGIAEQFASDLAKRVVGTVASTAKQTALSAADKVASKWGKLKAIVKAYDEAVHGKQVSFAGDDMRRLNELLTPFGYLMRSIDDLTMAVVDLEQKNATADQVLKEIDRLNLFAYLTYLNRLANTVPFVSQKELWRTLIATTLNNHWDEMVGGQNLSDEFWAFLYGKGLVKIAPGDMPAQPKRSDAKKAGLKDMAIQAGLLAFTSSSKFGPSSKEVLQQCAHHWATTPDGSEGLAKRIAADSAYGEPFEPRTGTVPEVLRDRQVSAL